MSRTNQAQSEAGCRVDAGGLGTQCPGPCDDSGGSSVTQTTTTIQRGATIDLRWPRNNHPGGFVRLAWAPSSSTTNAQFDAHAYRFECFEKGPFCASSSSTSTGDASTNTQTGCGSIITVPPWVTDGPWTLQWAWFGGYSALGDYYSCVNYQVSGGVAADSSDTTYGNPSLIVFAGGDNTNPNLQQCQFRNTDRLHQCVEEVCSTNLPQYPAGVAQTGVPVNSDGSSVKIIASTYPIQTTPSAASSLANSRIPCTANSDCKSGVCQVSGFCLASSNGLGAGGIAAIVFAMLVLVIVLAVAGFFFVNRKEVPFMVPFKGRT